MKRESRGGTSSESAAVAMLFLPGGMVIGLPILMAVKLRKFVREQKQKQRR